MNSLRLNSSFLQLLLPLLLVSFSSCKKEYTCLCTGAHVWEYQKPSTECQNFTDQIYHVHDLEGKRKEVEMECENMGEHRQESNPSVCGGLSITVSTSCALEEI